MGQRRVYRQVIRETYLDDEDEDRVLGVVGGGIGTLEDASLTRCSDGHGDSRLCQSVSVGQ